MVSYRCGEVWGGSYRSGSYIGGSVDMSYSICVCGVSYR